MVFQRNKSFADFARYQSVNISHIKCSYLSNRFNFFLQFMYLTISIITTKFYSNIPMQSVVIVIQRISPLLNLWPCYSPIEKLYINFATKPLVLAYKWV